MSGSNLNNIRKIIYSSKSANHMLMGPHTLPVVVVAFQTIQAYNKLLLNGYYNPHDVIHEQSWIRSYIIFSITYQDSIGKEKIGKDTYIWFSWYCYLSSWKGRGLAVIRLYFQQMKEFEVPIDPQIIDIGPFVDANAFGQDFFYRSDYRSFADTHVYDYSITTLPRTRGLQWHTINIQWATCWLSFNQIYGVTKKRPITALPTHKSW